jgi:hypothetical protein
VVLKIAISKVPLAEEFKEVKLVVHLKQEE